MMSYLLLSKKMNQNTFVLDGKHVFKTVLVHEFIKLICLKKRLKKAKIIHFYHYRYISKGRILLYYHYYNNEIHLLNYFRKNPQEYICYIGNSLYELNLQLAVYRGGFIYGYVHEEPHFMNYVIKGGEVYFIDGESIITAPIVFQPFYLFIALIGDKEGFFSGIDLLYFSLVYLNGRRELLEQYRFHGGEVIIKSFLKHISNKNHSNYNIGRKLILDNYTTIRGVINKI